MLTIRGAVAKDIERPLFHTEEEHHKLMAVDFYYQLLFLGNIKWQTYYSKH